MPLIQEFQTWHCVYCDTVNDYTDWRCYKCHKKKPKLSTVKRILAKRKKIDQQKHEAEKKAIIAKIDGIPQPEAEITFDLSKLDV